MEWYSFPTDLILSSSRRRLGYLYLDWNPQPGAFLEFEDQTYRILERRHRYHFKAGHYHLHKIALYVQLSQPPAESSLWHGHWVIGDGTCAYNARSELLRCAINPQGPCRGCTHYQVRQD